MDGDTKSRVKSRTHKNKQKYPPGRPKKIKILKETPKKFDLCNSTTFIVSDNSSNGRRVDFDAVRDKNIPSGSMNIEENVCFFNFVIQVVYL